MKLILHNSLFETYSIIDSNWFTYNSNRKLMPNCILVELLVIYLYTVSFYLYMVSLCIFSNSPQKSTWSTSTFLAPLDRTLIPGSIIGYLLGLAPVMAIWKWFRIVGKKKQSSTLFVKYLYDLWGKELLQPASCRAPHPVSMI